MRDASQFPRFSDSEMADRHRRVAALMDEHNLDAMLFYGAGRFATVDVEVGDSDRHYVQILSGLSEGTEYVSVGAFELKAHIVTSSLSGHAGHGH